MLSYVRRRILACMQADVREREEAELRQLQQSLAERDAEVAALRQQMASLGVPLEQEIRHYKVQHMCSAH